MKQLIIVFEFKEENIHKIAPFKTMLRNYKMFAFITDSSCIVWTEDSASDVRDNLKKGIGLGDIIFVGEVSAPAAWVTSVSQEVTDYLQKNLK